jgi:hypothetical protein
MNGHLNHLAVKAQMDDRIRAAERARMAGAGARDRAAGSSGGWVARALSRRLPRRRLGVRVESQPCLDEGANR